MTGREVCNKFGANVSGETLRRNWWRWIVYFGGGGKERKRGEVDETPQRLPNYDRRPS